MRRTVLSLFLILALALSVMTPAMAAEDPAVVAEPSGEPAEMALPETDETEEESSEEIEAPEEAEEYPEELEEPVEEQAEESVAAEAADSAMPMELDGASYQDKEQAIVAKIITDGMSDYAKLVAITRYAAENYSYSSDWTINGFLNNGAGSCDASTQFIIDLCGLAGIEAWQRKSGRDHGASSGHVCALARVDGEYYLADAGYSYSKPRPFDVFQIPDGLNVRDGVLYQYDGRGVEHLVIPEVSGSSYRERHNRTYTVAGETITRIGYDGQKCFCYGTGLKSVTIPKTVKTVTGTAFKDCAELENIYVDPDNPYFTSVDGVLYSKDLTRLVCVPAKKTSVALPATVKTQDEDAFYGGTIPVTRLSGTLPFKDVSDQWFADSVAFVYGRSLFKGTSATEFSPGAPMTRGMFITVLGRFARNGQAAGLESWSGTLGVTNGEGVCLRDKTTTEGSAILARIGSAGETVSVLAKVPAGEDGAVWYKVTYGGQTGYIREKNTGASGKTLLRVYTGGFEDLPNGAYYTGYAQWAYIHGIMNGVSAAAFRPERDIKREDICVLLYRYLTAYLGQTLNGSGSAFEDDGEISDYARTAVYAMRDIGVISGYPDNTFRPRANASRAEVATMFRNIYQYLYG